MAEGSRGGIVRDKNYWRAQAETQRHKKIIKEKKRK